MSFRIFTPWNKPRFPHGAHTIKNEWPDGSPMPHDMVNAILNGSPVNVRNPLRFLMKTKVGVRLRDISITNIENSTIGTLNLHGKIKQKTVNRTSSPFASFFSRLGKPPVIAARFPLFTPTHMSDDFDIRTGLPDPIVLPPDFGKKRTRPSRHGHAHSI